MSKEQNSKIRSPKASADELISSYLGDLFGSDSFDDSVDSVHANAEDEVIQVAMSPEEVRLHLQKALASASIERERSLITTVDLMELYESKAILSKPQSFLMLLLSLYYLRRPLTKKVKERFIEVSERMLDDYEASEWQAQITPSNGVRSKDVVSEART